MTTGSENAHGDLVLQIEIAGKPTRHFYQAATMGRAPSNDIVVDDDYVSGHHAEVRLVGDQWQIRDLESTNGTYVDGRRVDRVSLGYIARLRLGHADGPEIVLRVPANAPRDPTPPAPEPDAIAARYLGEEAPEDMSERTRFVRAAFQQQRQQDAHRWGKRILKLRVAVAGLLIVALGAAGLAYLSNRRVQAQRAAAAELFHTIKALELDIRRLEAAAGVDQSLLARYEQLERQYEDLLATLGVYSDDTREEVQLVYRIVHRFGESEANVPEEFVDEVLRYVERWRRSNLRAFVNVAHRNDYGRRIAATLLEHNLPPEFFYLALQESGLNTEAVGPETRFGFAKGMWQFIPQTAEQYGLRPGPLRGEPLPDQLDERHDFEKSTRAAARYLYDIYTTDAQASGLLVIASYNWGERNVIRLIQSMPETPRDRNFWKLLEQHRERIPEETYDYVFRIVSAAVIGENPQLFGFDFEPPLPAAASTNGGRQVGANG